MRIVIISAEYPPVWGGIGSVTYYLSIALAELGNEITIITRYHKDRSYNLLNLHKNIKIEEVKCLKAPSFSSLFFGVSSIKKLLSLNKKFDVIHLMYPLISLSKKVFNSIPFPIVSTMHGTWAGERMGLKGKKIKEFGINDFAIFFISPFFRKFEKIALKYSDALITVSNYCISEIREFYNYKNNNIFLISNGVDTRIFYPRSNLLKLYEKYDLPKLYKFIIFVGRFVARKGIFFLLGAFDKIVKEYKKVGLILVGFGPLEKRIKKEIIKKNIVNKVYFFGKLTSNELAELFSLSTVCVLPSSYEGQGIVLLESMACGTPCIGTNVGGIPDVIKNNKNGFIIEYGNVDMLYSALNSLLQNDSLRERMGKIGREMVLKKYDWLKIATETIKVYKYAIENSKYRK